jgi:hypothetical protein
MTKRIALVLSLLLAIGGAAFAGEATDSSAAAADAAKSLSVKTFQFQHKAADRAATVVRPLMSSDGSISIQPSTNSLVITDRAENLKSIAAALDKFDSPPQAFKLTLRLVVASRAAAAARMPDALKDVGGNLAILPFNNYDIQGNAVLEGKEGQPALLDLDSGYRADFKWGDYDAASDSVQIGELELSKLQGDQLTQVLKKTTMNLKIGQTVVFGAGKPQGAKALLLILAVKR